MNDTKRQYTITEDNDWEGEIFNYVMDLTEKEYDFIRNEFYNKHGSNSAFIITASNYTKADIINLNEYARNTYKDYIGFYKFKEDIFELYQKVQLDNNTDEELDDEDKDLLNQCIIQDNVFYKGIGLELLKP